MADEIEIEVAYARPDQQIIIPLRMSGEVTIEAAIRQSGLLERFPEIDLTKNKVGIFSRIAKLDATLRDKDRVEIYRALIADPKEVRRKRAEEGKAMKKGGGDMKEDSAAE